MILYFLQFCMFLNIEENKVHVFQPSNEKGKTTIQVANKICTVCNEGAAAKGPKRKQFVVLKLMCFYP